jgi:hypothetical protein
MKHISKIDGRVYELRSSVSRVDCKQYDDDITLIWYDKPYDDEKCYNEDPDARVLINWYWGEHDAESTDVFIEMYWRDKQ